MKTWKRMLSCVLALAMLVCLLPAALAADGHWADQAVDTLNGIYGAGVFTTAEDNMTEGDAYAVLSSMGCTSTKVTAGSTAALTRANACEVLAEVFELPVESGSSAIEYLYEQNIINGYADGTLGANESITKAQFAVITYRVLNAVGGGLGTAIETLKPGTKEFFSWLYLLVRNCYTFNDPITDVITEAEWNKWQSTACLMQENDEGKPNNLSVPFPSESMTRVEAAVKMVDACIAAGGPSNLFWDVEPDNWFYDGIMYLANRNITIGYGHGEFGPNDATTYFQLVAFLYRSVTEKWWSIEGGGVDQWEWATSKGYIDVDDEVDADEQQSVTVTRGEAVVAVLKACIGEKLISVDLDNVNVDILNRFSDAEEISDEDKPYIAYAVSMNLLNGTANGELDLDGTASRSMVGVFFYRVLIGVDTTKMQDYRENVAYAKDEASTIATFALFAARTSTQKTLVLTEDWRLTSNLDLNVGAGETLTIVGNGHHIYEMGGILTNTGAGTVLFDEGTYLYPAEGDTDAAAIKAEAGYTKWDEDASTELVLRRQPQGEAEAEVNGTEYATLAEAIAAAKEGDEVVLLKDVEIQSIPGAATYTGAITIDKPITLNGNGYAITAAADFGNTSIINVENSGAVTIKDLTVNGNGSSRHCINITSSANTTSKSVVTLENVVTTGGLTGVTINGSDVTVQGDKTNIATGSWKTAINVDSTDSCKNSASLTVKDGTIGVIYVENTAKTEEVKAEIKGGVVENVGISTAASADKTSVVVSAGNFGNSIKKEYLDTSLNAELKSASNPDAPYSYYATVDDATKAAQPGDTVRDLSGSTATNVTVTFADGYFAESTMSVPAGSTITLPTPARDGYSFGGWSDGTKTYNAGDAYVVTGKVTFTAKWSRSSTTPSLPVIGGVMNGLGSQVQSPFVDVTTMDYYYDAVNWAVEEGITTGTGRYSFSPDEACTRAQAVTFLWRAAGSPTPKSTTTPFVDVDSNAYYAKAVAWAVENGITVGTSATTFSPADTCTRAQIVTFLYRAFGKRVNTTASFTDVAADAYYAPAVAWAAANSITGGTGNGKFSPAATCTRAQIVTFLYRCCG